MQKFLRTAMICVCIVACFSSKTLAVEFSNSTIVENEPAYTIQRASGEFSMTISAYKKSIADKEFPLSAGETVRIRATYDPVNASLDFGLLDSSNVFHYINVTTGSIDKTITVPERGNYKLAIRNNSKNSVKVTGFVTY